MFAHVVFAEPGPSPCRPDEEYRTCDCVRTCCNRGNPEACDKQCFTGCFCKDGLVRDKRGDCVSPEDCPTEETPGKRKFCYVFILFNLIQSYA